MRAPNALPAPPVHRVLPSLRGVPGGDVGLVFPTTTGMSRTTQGSTTLRSHFTHSIGRRLHLHLTPCSEPVDCDSLPVIFRSTAANPASLFAGRSYTALPWGGTASRLLPRANFAPARDVQPSEWSGAASPRGRRQPFRRPTARSRGAHRLSRATARDTAAPTARSRRTHHLSRATARDTAAPTARAARRNSARRPPHERHGHRQAPRRLPVRFRRETGRSLRAR